MVGIRSSAKGRTQTVGTLLRAARRQHHRSLVEVATALRIPVGQLRSLEEGDVSVFPAEVYARGVFFKYAQYLHLEIENAQQLFLRELAGVREVVPLKILTPAHWWQRFLNPRLLLWSAGGVVAVVVGMYLAWQVQSFLRLPQLTVVEPMDGYVATDTVTVQGYAAHQSTVQVNGESVLLTPEGAFQVVLPLHPGINVLRVEATNAAGRTKIVQKDLLNPRPKR